MHKNINRYFWLLLVAFVAFPALNVYAEGSRDLYPSGAAGGRAYLRASTTESLAFPFPNLGTHFVYAEAGEQIAIATNAQSGQIGNNARIRLYGPDGSPLSLNITNDNGNIPSRDSEIAGPRLPDQGAGENRYLPIYYEVEVSGIYKVEFRGNSGNSTGDNRYGYSSATTWPSNQNNRNYLIAWDISVAKGSGSSWSWVPGRVYTNVLNMDNPSYGGANGNDNSSFRPNSGFHGNFKVLTRDGYIYNVDNNGSQGISFTFMVNNRGFHEVGNPNVPAYTSIPSPSAEAVQARYHDPNSADKEAAVTHKIFYNLPDQNMPASAIGGPVAGQTTWLRPEEKVLNVTYLEVLGAEGSTNKLGNKGAYIEFYNESGGDYYIAISPKPASSVQFPVRELKGSSQFGENRVYWDGKDGEGESLSHGLADVNVELRLRGAEVHFPYIDMELNHDGIIIELLSKNNNYTTPVSDKVFWDDSDIRTVNTNTYGSMTDPRNASHTVYPNGTSSKTNGHIWGTGSNRTSGTFGDEHGMDTWTFIEGDAITVDFEVDVRIADLYTDISRLLVNGEPSSSASEGDEVTYTVVVGNNGPSNVEDAPFSFILPPGFKNVGELQYSNNDGCGIETEPITYDESNNKYNSKLTLPNGCEITYTFTAQITSDYSPDNTEAFATILRPNDVTDPDATNISNPQKPLGDPNEEIDIENYYYLPTDPFFEAEYNGRGGVSNNISSVVLDLDRISDLAIVKSADNEEAKVGDEITFTLTITNNGPHDAIGVVIRDFLPDGYTLGVINDEGVFSEGVITWDIGSLAKSSSVSVSFKATVNIDGSYLNIAEVDGDVEDPDRTNNQSQINPVLKNNYWLGGKVGAPNEWDDEENWTGGYVPASGEDIEFATEVNNPTVDGDPMSGPAKDHLYLGDGNSEFNREIGDLINDSDKDLWITTGDQLTINGEVKDNNADGGTIVVKASPNKPTGTLVFTDPTKNENVGGIVEFYNQAYDCEDCGFYTRSWQYFGIPVKESGFPSEHVAGNETVNQWVEPFNGNKWQPAPYTPDTNLKAFKGYQITNDVTEQPTGVYSFNGTLNVGDASVGVTRTAGVNYLGANLIGNSYTASIPISSNSMSFPEGVQQTVYLFNTGTRDEWRKLNGTVINQSGYKSGQYLAVPVNLGGTDHFPDRIPSMHSFMVLAESGIGGDLTIDYSKLVKNTTVALGDGSTQIVTRSTTATENNKFTSTSTIPSLVMDVIGEESADRVWIFAKEGTTHGFDNGWDGRKMAESGIAQLYVAGTDESQLQVATVPSMNNVTLGFEADNNGKYTLEFSLSGRMNGVEVYLHDRVTGSSTRVTDGGTYSFEAAKGEATARFRLTSTGNFEAMGDEALIDVEPSGNGKITIRNGSGNACTVFVSNDKGGLLQRVEVSANEEKVLENMTAGMYVIRLQNAAVNDARRVIVE